MWGFSLNSCPSNYVVMPLYFSLKVHDCSNELHVTVLRTAFAILSGSLGVDKMTAKETMEFRRYLYVWSLLELETVCILSSEVT